jgi:hypothetical protein
MNPDPFASSTFSLVLSWISAFPVLIAAAAIPFTTFGKELRGYRALFVWFGVCLLALSPLRYLFFLLVAGSSYIFQSWGAFFSVFILGFYIPIVFGLLYSLGVGVPFLAVSVVIGKREDISFDRGILAAVVFPITCIISSCLFYLVLPAAAWTIRWLNPNDVIKATNGPSAMVYRYVAVPCSTTMVPGIFPSTPQSPEDLLRCHVATTYMGKQEFWYFVKKQYPEIYARKLRETSR